MKIQLVRKSETLFPEFENPEEIIALKVWHCKYKSLKMIIKCKNLKALSIASYPDADFEIIGELNNLEWLEIIHFPKVSNITPLVKLTKLKSLSLESLPSWDSSGKRLVIDSLLPIANIKNIENLQLLGVIPKDNTIECLRKLPNLRTVKLHGYDHENIQLKLKVSECCFPDYDFSQNEHAPNK